MLCTKVAGNDKSGVFCKIEAPTFGGLRPPNPPMIKIKKNHFYLSIPSFFFSSSFSPPPLLSPSSSFLFSSLLFSASIFSFVRTNCLKWWDEETVSFFTFCFVIFSPPEAVVGRFSSECANSKVFPKWENQTIFRFFFRFLRFWTLPMANLPHWRCWDRIEIAMDTNNFLEKNNVKEKIILNRITTLFYLFFC